LRRRRRTAGGRNWPPGSSLRAARLSCAWAAACAGPRRGARDGPRRAAGRGRGTAADDTPRATGLG
jgi:hypothetical protein